MTKFVSDKMFNVHSFQLRRVVSGICMQYAYCYTVFFSSVVPKPKTRMKSKQTQKKKIQNTVKESII